jgi:hypothetical protein
MRRCSVLEIEKGRELLTSLLHIRMGDYPAHKTGMTVDHRLQQALRTLRAIRQRYETGRSTSSDYVRSYSVQVALGYADMLWVTAAIEVLEKAVAGSLD